MWIEVAGAYAMFDTPTSPVTQTFGLGLFDEVTDAEIDRIAQFFQERGAPVFHEVSPLADPALLALLSNRNYRPIEFTSVMFRPIDHNLLETNSSANIQARVVQKGEEELWAQTTARGWSHLPELTPFILEMAKLNAHSPAVSFFAERDGRPIATGGLCLWQGVALLAGACTVPEARKQGAQLALLESRLRYAREHGCDIAMICAQPGSASQRNAERHGFRIAYTRIKWERTRAVC
jgi:GNAT superfamily N-acetyltransferase